MEDFLIDNYSLLTKAVIFLAALVGLITLKKFRQTEIRYFIYFLVYVLFLEIIAYYPSYFLYFRKFHLIEGSIIEKNYWWYTLSWCMGSALFFSFYFQRAIKNSLYKAILRYGRYVFVFSSLVYLIFNFEKFFSSIVYFIYLFGIMLVLVSIVLYFIELISTERILLFYKSIQFYIGGILLIWYLSTTPLIFYDMYTDAVDWDFIILTWKIRLMANIFMYLGFASVLLLCKPESSIQIAKK